MGDLVELVVRKKGNNEYVREFGEGVDRMYYGMEQAGLPFHEYRTEAFLVYSTIKIKSFWNSRFQCFQRYLLKKKHGAL